MTQALFIVCCVVFALTGYTADMGAEPWRIYGSMFLHAGVVHLAVNVIFGLSWGKPLERYVGPVRLPLIFVGGGVCAALAGLLVHGTISPGASGSVAAMMAAMFVVYRDMLGSWSRVWGVEKLRGLVMIIIVWLGVGPLFGLDSAAHAGGLVGGLVLGSLLVPSARDRITARLTAA